MAKLTRLTGKLFGETATATGDNPQIGQFGSGLAGTYVGTTDVATIQNLTAWSNGFIGCVTPTEQYPPLPEMTGFGKVLSYQENYLLQQGIAEWDSATPYYTNSYCSYNGIVYVSLSDNNTNNNPASTPAKWAVYGNTIFANKDLSNLSTTGESRLHALKSYLDKGELLTDSIGLADVKNYARSTFDGTKFTSVGSPTISADGILTGISGTDYAKVSLSTSGTSILIRSRFLYSSSSVAGDVYSGSGNNRSPRLMTGGTSITAYITQSGTTASLAIAKNKLTDNTWYTTEHSISPTAQTFTIYDDDGNVIDTKSGTTAITVNVSTILATLNMGWYSLSEYFSSSIDLKGFQVYVDNTQVFNGNQTGTDTYTINSSTVTIPYVLSKTGSKIADSSYRTAVASVYNELGYSPYYTLSDTDFTLPQGEIYGLMLNQSTPHIVESYENGKSGYIVYSNGLCKQWGYLATTSSSKLEYTATLFKTFKDTNYSFYRSTDWTAAASSYNDNFSSFYDVGYTDKTTTTVSFWMHENTYQNGTDWVAFGYIN